MRYRGLLLSVMIVTVFAAPFAFTAERGVDKAVGSTATRPPAPLDTRAMNAMLRADRDKDGVLSREELEQYDIGLARRFQDVDADRDGKLTFTEFEHLLPGVQQTSASAR
jgi:hypothetical protein